MTSSPTQADHSPKQSANKLIIAAGLVIAVLVAAYLGSVVFIGMRTTAAVADYQALLTASDEILVHRLDYERGLQSGQLHYDLEWSPPPGNTWFPLIDLIRQDDPNAFRFNGSADITHGPWVGGSDPFALARVTLDYHLPDSARRELPQYPANTPLFSLTGILGFDGQLRAQLDGVEYDGTVILDNDSENLVFSGLSGTAAVAGDLSEFSISARLGENSVGQAPGNLIRLAGLEFSVDGREQGSILDLRFGWQTMNVGLPEFELTELSLENLQASSTLTWSEPGLWLDDTQGRIGLYRIAGSGISMDLRDLSGSSNTTLTGEGLINSVGRAEFGEITLNDEPLDSFELEVAMRDMNAQAYADLLQLSSQFGTDPEAAAAQLEDLQSIINATLSDGPSITLDLRGLAADGAERFSASLTTGYDGPAVDLDQIEQVLTGMYFRGEMTVARAAARDWIRLVLSEEGSFTGAALEAEVDSRMDDFIISIQDTGFATLTGNSITSSLDITEGNVTVNGNDMGNMGDLMAQFIGSPEEEVPTSADVAVVDQSLFPAEARLEDIALESGFMPDPFTLPVQGGGNADSASVLGVGFECVGNVNSRQPDIILNYSASDLYSLYFYAESESDTTLLVLAEDGWHCDDDGHGEFNPGVLIPEPTSGRYLIWVGTYDGGQADAEFGISENY